MITVAGFNTAIDRLICLDELIPGAIQRARAAQSLPGGKGLHVAQTIAALDVPVQLIGLTDTAHHEMISDWLARRGVVFHGVEIEEDLRICTALREHSGRISEILEPGPELKPAECARLIDTLQRCVDDSDLIVLSGSLPRGFDDDAYARIVRGIEQQTHPCLVDTSGGALHCAAEGGPFLLKPNRDEAGELVGRAVDSIADAAAAVRILHQRGISWPVITLGIQGAVGFDGKTLWHSAVDIEPGGYSVGSGDCFLAGLAVSLYRKQDFADALRLATACGAANAAEAETGYVRRPQVEALLPQIRVTRIH